MSYVMQQEITRGLEQKLSNVLSIDAMRKTIETLDEILSAYEINRVADDDAGYDYMIDAFIEAKTVEGCSQKTLIIYRYELNRFFAKANVTSRHVTPYHIRQYLSEGKARGLADKTLRHQRDIFSNYFNWLHRDGLITKNPMANINTVKCAKVVKEVFTECDLERIKSACDTIRNKAIVYFLKASGCRVGEVELLNRSDIDLTRMECVVRGKGNKERFVYLDSVTTMVLRDYLATRTDDNPALFIGKGGRRLEQGGIRTMLNKLSKLSGVKHIHPHKFRRTEFTVLSKKGMPAEHIRILAGHEKIDTTLGYVMIDNDTVKSSYRQYA